MLGRTLDAGVPAAWVTADEAWLEQHRVGYVVAVVSRQAVAGDVGTSRATPWPHTLRTRHGSPALMEHRGRRASLEPQDGAAMIGWKGRRSKCCGR
jgi:hypothetical protein